MPYTRIQCSSKMLLTSKLYGKNASFKQTTHVRNASYVKKIYAKNVSNHKIVFIRNACYVKVHTAKMFQIESVYVRNAPNVRRYVIEKESRNYCVKKCLKFFTRTNVLFTINTYIVYIKISLCQENFLLSRKGLHCNVFFVS